MTQVQTDQSITLIFKDQAGDYFFLPRELMDQCRVPAEQKAEVEQALTGATPIGEGGDDTQGFVLPLVFLAGVAVRATTATAAGMAAVYWYARS